MDLKIFKQHLRSASPLNESPTSNLAHEIQTMHKAGSLRKMADRVESVLAHVMSIEQEDKFFFRRKAPHLISRLETLLDMLQSGSVDPSEAEILQKEIVSDIRKL
jgi:hypothetical protein